MSETIKVDIWSDVQCPWCYIGKRKFEAGVAAFGADVEVEYHSFELAPDTPLDYEGSTFDFASEHKGIPVDEVRKMIGQITGASRLEPDGPGRNLPGAGRQPTFAGPAPSGRPR